MLKMTCTVELWEGSRGESQAKKAQQECLQSRVLLVGGCRAVRTVIFFFQKTKNKERAEIPHPAQAHMQTGGKYGIAPFCHKQL